MRLIGPKRETLTKKQYKDANRTYLVFAEIVRERLQREAKGITFFLNPTVAVNVVVATYDDIDRYKAYHLRNLTPYGTTRSDSVKRASYFAKWTNKLRPISFKTRTPPINDPYDMSLMANETLAAAYAIELIGEELKKTFKLTEKSFGDLLYDFHYRELNEGAYLAYFQLIWDLVSAGKKNPIVEIGVI